MKRIALICMLVFLVGCSTVVDLAVKTADVWMDPSIPVGEPEDRPSMLTLSMSANSQVNPNIYNDNALAVQTEEPQAPVEKLPADPQEALDQEAAVTADPEETFKPEATPIAFKIIQLKDNSLFLQADFEGLSTDMEKTLGTTYITHDDFMLVPNEFKFVEPFEVEDSTRYIAVAAAYNDYASKQWKGIVKIKPKGKEYSLLLHFNEQQVVIKKQEL